MTIQEMADQLKLGRATVSAVLNNNKSKQRVSEATRKRVLEFAKKHNFHQNISALSMRGKYSKALGVVGINSYRYPAHGLLLNALESYANRHEISSVMFSTYGRSSAGLSEVVQQIKLYNVRKLIVVGTCFNQTPELLLPFLQNIKHHLPSTRCLIYGYDIRRATGDIPLVSSVFGDEDKRYGLLNRIALDNGYQKIVMLGMLPPTFRFNSVEIEYAGEYMDFIGYKPQYMVRDKFFIDHGRRLADDINGYDFSSKKTLIYIQDDFVSMGFARQMQQHGHRIPDDFGLVSWDNLPATECLGISSLGYDHDLTADNIVNWINSDNPEEQYVELGIALNSARSF